MPDTPDLFNVGAWAAIFQSDSELLGYIAPSEQYAGNYYQRRTEEEVARRAAEAVVARLQQAATMQYAPHDDYGPLVPSFRSAEAARLCGGGPVKQRRVLWVAGPWVEVPAEQGGQS